MKYLVGSLAVISLVGCSDRSEIIRNDLESRNGQLVMEVQKLKAELDAAESRCINRPYYFVSFEEALKIKCSDHFKQIEGNIYMKVDK